MVGLVAIITGNGRGFGRVLADTFRHEGFVVPPCTRNEVDVRHSDSIKSFIHSILEQHGRIDVLVNNAAILGPVGPLESNALDEWQETITVNLLGSVQMIHGVLPSMKTRRSGRIINIAGGGATNALPRRSAYAASKAALVRLTESVAEEVSGDGIAVNAVLPGPMPTDMYNEIIESGPDRLGEAEHQEHVSHKADMEQASDRAAKLCLYLASRESDGLTGRTISARYDPWPFNPSTIADIMASDAYTLRRRELNGD